LWVLCRAQAASPPSIPWQTNAVGRFAAVVPDPAERTGFRLVSAAQTGLDFQQCLPESRHLTNQILLNGSGVAAGDVDGDGWCDLYFSNLDGPNALYRNLGHWRFEDITARSGTACPEQYSTGVALVDLEGDGDLDLIVSSLGNGTRIFYNDGKAHFEEAAFVLNPGQGGTSLAFADVDGDGYLDLYAANYRSSALMDIPNARATFQRVDGRLVMETFSGRPTTDADLTNRFVVMANGQIDELGQPDVLYRSVRGRAFEPVGFDSGSFLDEAGQPLSEPLREWGLTAVFRDFNQDGWPDLYVCNDFRGPDRFWVNEGQGRLRLLPMLAVRRTSMFSMAMDFADVNRDGHDDFFVLDMMSREHAQRMRYLESVVPPSLEPGQFEDRPQYGINVLLLNRGDQTFAEIGQLAGLQASEWSWSCVFQDVDLDGWEDILVANGMERAARDLDVVLALRKLRATGQPSDAEIFAARRMFPRLDTANLAFRNRGDLTFEEAGERWGFDLRGISNGMALADLDNDGDLDVVLNNLNAPPALLENTTPAPRLAIRLRGLPPNTRGIGARIEIRDGPVPIQTQEMIAGSRYVSSDDPIRTFAAGSLTNRLSLAVRWPSGRVSRIAEVRPNRLYEVFEPEAAPAPREPPAPDPAPWFEPVTSWPGHRHHEPAFDDYARQPLLPHKLSQLGPGVAWIDLDRDGWEDLVIGAGRGGKIGLFRNRNGRAFELATDPLVDRIVTRDQTSLLGWPSAGGRRGILAGLSNYEDGLSLGAAVWEYDLEAKVVRDFVTAIESSAGMLVAGDVEGDGDLDLFVAGRVVPGKYPAAAASRLFRNEQGRLVPDAEFNARLRKVGLVTAALFTDLTGNGLPELVLAVEWGPIRIFENHQGQWVDRTVEWGISPYTGWWNSVAAADFDNDGRLDLVAGNWGRNTPQESFRHKPLRIYHGDLDGSGVWDILEAHHEVALDRYVPERQLPILAGALPHLSERFPSNRAFSTAGIDEILEASSNRPSVLEAAWLESTILLNRGRSFEVRTLPVEAQFAPVFGVVAGDFDGDGAEDLILAQNFFALPFVTPRYEGVGFCCRGMGEEDSRWCRVTAVGSSPTASNGAPPPPISTGMAVWIWC
jgi:hypothetical protein